MVVGASNHVSLWWFGGEEREVVIKDDLGRREVREVFDAWGVEVGQDMERARRLNCGRGEVY